MSDPLGEKCRMNADHLKHQVVGVLDITMVD